MTRDEYATDVADQLKIAHNNNDSPSARRIFEDVDKTLISSGFDANNKTEFWRIVYRIFHSSQILIEKQGNSALHALYQYIEAQIKARGAGK